MTGWPPAPSGGTAGTPQNPVPRLSHGDRTITGCVAVAALTLIALAIGVMGRTWISPMAIVGALVTLAGATQDGMVYRPGEPVSLTLASPHQLLARLTRRPVGMRWRRSRYFVG